MALIVYIIRCAFMFLVTWTGVRLIGKKSIANMTTYDLAAVMLLTTVAAEPLVFKISSKAAVGVMIITVITMFVGMLSLKEYFYHIDAAPIVIIANGKIFKDELKKARMNVPLMLSELRIQGYSNISDVAFAVLEPSGKISVIPTSQSRPVQPSDMAMTTNPVRLSFPVIIDGKLKEQNLKFAKKDRIWLMEQLKICGVSRIEDVLIAQMDSSGNLYIDLQEKDISLPEIL
ncbi:MAG: DUF421 domain-containing protein [Bacillota bacterium]